MNAFLINLKEKGNLKAWSRELGAGSGTTQITILPYALRPLPCANGRTFPQKKGGVPMRR